MRNYETEIEDLKRDIEHLKLEKTDKETQLKPAIDEQCESKRTKELPALRDKNGSVISVGDSVKATTPGKFIRKEGKVKSLKKWVTFEDITGTKQVRYFYIC